MFIYDFQDDYKCGSSAVLHIQSEVSAGTGHGVYYDYMVTVMYPLVGHKSSQSLPPRARGTECKFAYGTSADIISGGALITKTPLKRTTRA